RRGTIGASAQGQLGGLRGAPLARSLPIALCRRPREYGGSRRIDGPHAGVRARQGGAGGRAGPTAIDRAPDSTCPYRVTAPTGSPRSSAILAHIDAMHRPALSVVLASIV